MNRLLIGTLDILNKILALFIIVSTTISGYYGDIGGFFHPMYEGPGHVIVWTIIGFIAGVILAAAVSGVLAAIIVISREAMAIHQILLDRYPVTTIERR